VKFNKPRRAAREENLGARSTDRGSPRDDRLRINISRVAGAARNITLDMRAHAEWKFSACQTARERNIRREGSFPVPTGNSYFLFSPISSFSPRRVKRVLLSVLPRVRYSGQRHSLKFMRHAGKKVPDVRNDDDASLFFPLFFGSFQKIYMIAKWINIDNEQW